MEGEETHLGERDSVSRRGGVTHAGGALQDILLELIGRVVDALGGLRARQRPVDSARRFRGVASQEGALVEQEHPPAVFQHGVRRGEASEAASDDDDLFSHARMYAALASLMDA